MVKHPSRRHDYPTSRQTARAFNDGREAALTLTSGQPHPAPNYPDTFTGGCLAAAWHRGFANGLQQRLADKYGDAPAPPGD